MKDLVFKMSDLKSKLNVLGFKAKSKTFHRHETELPNGTGNRTIGVTKVNNNNQNTKPRNGNARPKSAHAHSASRRETLNAKLTQNVAHTERLVGRDAVTEETKRIRKQLVLQRTNQKRIDEEQHNSDSIGILGGKAVVKNLKHIHERANTKLNIQLQKQSVRPTQDKRNQSETNVQISYTRLNVNLNQVSTQTKSVSAIRNDENFDNIENNNNMMSVPVMPRVKSEIPPSRGQINILRNSPSRIPIASYKTAKMPDGSVEMKTSRGDVKVIYPDDEEEYYKDLDPVEYFDDKSVWDLPLPSPNRKTRNKQIIISSVVMDTSEHNVVDNHVVHQGLKPTLKRRPWSETIQEQEKMLMNRKKCVNTNNSVFAMFFDDSTNNEVVGNNKPKIQVTGFKGQTVKPQGEKRQTGNEHLSIIREEGRAPASFKYSDNKHVPEDVINGEFEIPKWAVQQNEIANKKRVAIESNRKYLNNALTVRGYRSQFDRKMARRPYSDLNLSESEMLGMRIGYENNSDQFESVITKYENKDHFRNSKQQFQRAPFGNVPKSEMLQPKRVMLSSEKLDFKKLQGFPNKPHIHVQPRRLKPVGTTGKQ